MNIDNRRHYILMLDTETANTITTESGGMDMSNVLVYDVGWAVIDTAGHLYETASFVNRDIFCYERDLMQSAYYGWKIPRYLEEIAGGSRVLADMYEIRKAMLETLERYGIKEVCAHNARFDANALNVTQAYVNKSKYRYWFPFDSVVWWDTLKMAKDILGQKEGYKNFCERNGYTLKNGKPRMTAEIIYRYISGQYDFEESHTGLEDVLIEAQILWYCFKQHKPMQKELYPPREPREPLTEFQIELLRSLRENPMVNMGGH